MAVAVDIVLPCYNPNEEWTSELVNFYESLSTYYQLKFIVVNDGSNLRDPSGDIALLRSRDIPIEYHTYEKNRGKGFALRTGVSRSTAPFVLYTDIDFPFTNESACALLSKLVEGQYDVVAGYRSAKYYQNKMSASRRLLSRTFRWFLRRGLSMPLTDTQCGIKGFNAIGRKVFISTTIDRYLFDFEFIYLCVRSKTIRITTSEVALKENVVFRKMKPAILLQESTNLLKVLLRSGRKAV